MRKALFAAAAVSGALLLSGCETTTPAPAASAPKPAAAAPAPVAAAPAPATASVTHYFMAMPEGGRWWIFGDAKNYLDYVAHGEVQLTRTRIGVGPSGQTVIFGITNDDVKKNAPSAGELIFDGKSQVTGPFYGEIFRDGRFLVFGEWADFQDYLKHNEITFTHTRIGEGPKGETVIYALNKKTVKEGPPVALIAQFNALRGKK